MKVVLSQVQGDDGLLVEDDIDPKDLDLDIGVMQFPEPLRVSAKAWKDKNDLTVEVHVEGQRRFTCSLCLEEFNNLFEKDFTLHYDVKGLEAVILDPELRDEIIIDHPIRIVCRESCRGLCLFCGADLNHEKCDCREE